MNLKTSLTMKFNPIMNPSSYQQVFNSSSLSNTAPLSDSTNTYAAPGAIGSGTSGGGGGAGTIGQNVPGNQGAGTIGQNSLGQKAMGPQNSTPSLGQRSVFSLLFATDYDGLKLILCNYH